jgi:hypothetical protein
VGGRLAVELAAATGWVLVDAGRWEPHQPTANRLQGADVLGLVCRSTAPSIAHARDLLPSLRSRGSRVAVVLVGDAPYGRAEVAEVLDVPLLGPLAWDVRGLSALWTRGVTPAWLSRSALGRSARRVLDELGALVNSGAGAEAAADRSAASGEEAEGEEVLR